METLLTTEFRVVAIDETRYWSEEIQKACGTIKAVYMYDSSVTTNLCEITPSYELTPLYYITENDISDELHGEMASEDMESIYMHCNVVDDLESIETENGFDFESSEDEEYKDGFEEVREYLNCNHIM